MWIGVSWTLATWMDAGLDRRWLVLGGLPPPKMLNASSGSQDGFVVNRHGKLSRVTRAMRSATPPTEHQSKKRLFGAGDRAWNQQPNGHCGIWAWGCVVPGNWAVSSRRFPRLQARIAASWVPHHEDYHMWVGRLFITTIYMSFEPSKVWGGTFRLWLVDN